MFVASDRFARRVRAAAAGDQGASLILVIAYMSMAFIIAATIAAACLFAIQQNVRAEASVQAIAAAEAGRDAVVSAFEIAPESCPSTGQYTDDPTDATDPTFTVTVHPTASASQPADASGIPQRCPTSTDKWVVLHATGTAEDGSTSVIDAVYPWERFRVEVAGGALGYMDSSYSATFSSISGDTVIKNGNFSCTGGTVFKGNVFVLKGNVNVGVDAARLTGEPSCEITGDLFVNGSITTGDPTWVFVWFYARLKVGGQIKATGTIDAAGRVEAGTDSTRPYRDIVAGTITTRHSQGQVLTFNGGSIKAVTEIDIARGTIAAAGNLATNGDLAVDGGREGLGNVNGVATSGAAVVVGGSITGNNLGSVTGQTGVTAGVSILGDGSRTAPNGPLAAVVNIGGAGARSGRSVAAGGGISASGTVTATAGDILVGAGGISGTGTGTASGSVLSAGAISTSGAVTANGGNVHSGAAISGGTRTASGSVLAVGNISSGAVQAKSGSISTNGSISGTATRWAGASETAAVGDITAKGSFASGTSTTARDVFATGSIKVDGKCTISRDVWAGTTVTFDDTVNSTSRTWNSPTCTIGQNVSASATATKSTLGSYTAPSNCVGSSCLTAGTYPATRLAAAAPSIRVPAGWNTGKDRFMNSGGTVGTAGTGTTAGAPPVPTVPTVTAPTVTAPAIFSMTLNENPDGTWETFDDLQLRSTWVDLGTYTTSWPGYTVLPPLSGTACNTQWFNPGGNIAKILSNASAQTVAGIAVPAKDPVVIDATACGNVTMAWSTMNLARDAVLLVDSATFSLAPFGASNLAAGQTRQLFVVQVDLSNVPRIPAWGGTVKEPVPDCTLPPTVTSRRSIEMSIAPGWGSALWNDRVSILLYSPCGITGSIGKAWKGHIYVHNDTVVQDVLSTMECRPMQIPGVVDLPCDINDVSSLGSMRVNAYRLGDRVAQTEY